jgi:thiol-disulfide isomerase/thioredoxin
VYLECKILEIVRLKAGMNSQQCRKRHFLKAGVAALIFAISRIAIALPEAARPTRLPAIKLNALVGGQIQLDSLQGKVVMVNFWATWCPPCRAEMPSIEKLYQSLKGSQFEVLGINQGESAEKIATKMGMFDPPPTFPILVDPSREVGKYFGVEDLPLTLIFNKKGQLVGRANGARDFNSAVIRQRVAELLGE